MNNHFIIPDIQARPGELMNHCEWVGKYIAEKKPDVVINLGDHADMASLSSWDRGTLKFEGRRFVKDVQASDLANSLLLSPAQDDHDYWDRLTTHILYGNHENRIDRFVAKNPELDQFVDRSALRYDEWYDNVHEFLVPIEIDGVLYAHYFYQPNTGRPLGGMINTRLKNVGCSFTMGHQQGLDYGLRTIHNGRQQHGLIAGSCYLHFEDYKGPQGNDHWRGIVQCYNVERGDYDAKFVSLDSLCKRYEDMPLKQFMRTTDRHIIA